MGYRSDVRVIMKKEAFNKLIQIVEEESNKISNNEYNFNLIKKLDVYKNISNNQVYFGWKYIKWYEECEDVKIIEDALEEIEKLGYGSNFARIGESYDDIEEFNIEGKNDKEYIDYPYILRQFDDLEYEEDDELKNYYIHKMKEANNINKIDTIIDEALEDKSRLNDIDLANIINEFIPIIEEKLNIKIPKYDLKNDKSALEIVISHNFDKYKKDNIEDNEI